MADFLQQLKVALGAILNGDGPVGTAGTLQNLAGRATKLAVEWNGLTNTPDDIPLPLIAVDFEPFHQTGADGDTRQGWVVFSVFAEGNGAQAKADAMAERIETIITGSAFLAQALDAVPRILSRLQLPRDQELTRELHRSDVRILIEGMKTPAAP